VRADCLGTGFFQGLLGLLIMRLGKGIVKGLINRAGELLGIRKGGKWMESTSQLELRVKSL
jgi:hypothetical protein